MISFWAARGWPGSQVITQGGSEEDPTIIDSSRRNGAADTATVFKLVSRQREGRIRYGPWRDLKNTCYAILKKEGFRFNGYYKYCVRTGH